MTSGTEHSTVVTGTDNSAYQVSVNEWNAAHRTNAQTVTILTGNTSIDVNHTLGVVPSVIIVEPQDDLAGKQWFITNRTTTQFTLNINSPDLQDHIFIVAPL